MKKYLSLFFLLFGFSYCFSQKKSIVTISGFAYNFNNAVTVEDKSELEDLTIAGTERIFIADSNHKFNIQFQLEKANYFRIGRNILYISPGDSMMVSIDFLDPKKAQFSGNHFVENNYLTATPYPNGGSYLEAGDSIKASVEKTIQFILGKGKARQTELDKIKGYVDAEFYRLESVRIKADMINSMRDQNLSIYYEWAHKTPKDSISMLRKQIELLTAYSLKKLSVDMVDPANLKLAVYRNVLPIIQKNQPVSFKSPTDIVDWEKGSEIKRKAVSLENKEAIVVLKKDAENIKNTQYRNIVIGTIDQLTKLNTGDVAKEIELTNVSGKKTALSSFKNKVIYLEFWATWCGPCLQEKPAMEELINTFKGNDSVVILSVSIDEDPIKWKNYLVKHSKNSHEYIVDRVMLKDYNLIGVPRMVLIDKNFKIVLLNAPGPRSKQLKELLKQ
ncbi:MAG: TlpA disulfide reductase family protein [Sediminibacterium sp.]|nr:TlpA disulfide reductase family protein [Sediminibacterium sp.]